MYTNGWWGCCALLDLSEMYCTYFCARLFGRALLGELITATLLRIGCVAESLRRSCASVWSHRKMFANVWRQSQRNATQRHAHVSFYGTQWNFKTRTSIHTWFVAIWTNDLWIHLMQARSVRTHEYDPQHLICVWATTIVRELHQTIKTVILIIVVVVVVVPLLRWLLIIVLPCSDKLTSHISCVCCIYCSHTCVFCSALGRRMNRVRCLSKCMGLVQLFNISTV